MASNYLPQNFAHFILSKTCCALSVLPYFGILRGICNLVALLLWDLLLRNHPSCAFIRALGINTLVYHSCLSDLGYWQRLLF